MPNEVKDELLPCPFCGNANPFIEGQPSERHVTCNNDLCQASIMPEATDAKAVAAWNTRALRPQREDAGAGGGVAPDAYRWRHHGGPWRWFASALSDAARDDFVRDMGGEISVEVQALYAAPQPSAPEGLVLVPREPTEAMIEAGVDALREHTQLLAISRDPLLVWRYMLAALASPPTGRDATEEGWQATRDAKQQRVAEWCAAAFGAEHQASVPQRGLRMLEEAIEAFQATNGSPEVAHKLIDYIFAKEPGELFQELGGLGVTTLALAAAAGLSADEAELTEIKRVLSKPLQHFWARNKVKNDAGFDALAYPSSAAPKPETAQKGGKP